MPCRLASAVVVLLAAAPALAQDTTLSHQGYVVGSTDAPLDASLAMTFTIWKSATSTAPGDRLWTESYASVPVRAGYYAIDLGTTAGNRLGAATFRDHAELYLGIAIGAPGSAELSPRQRLRAAPQADAAARAYDLACAGCVEDGEIAGLSASKVTGRVGDSERLLGRTLAQLAGTGLSAAGDQLHVKLGPTATDAAAGDHAHDARYYTRSELALPAATPAIDFSWLTNAPAAGGTYTAAAGGGLTLSGPAFSLATDAASLAKVSGNKLSVATNDVVATNGLRIGTTTTCADGMLRYDTNRLQVCISAGWRNVATNTGGVAIEAWNGGRRFADGTYATSCRGYRYPVAGYEYSGATGSGTYWITQNGTQFTVYCNQDDHGGGWTLVLRAGVGVDLTPTSTSAAFGTSAPLGPTDPGAGQFQKLSDASINLIRTNLATQVGYWVTTPGSGTGLYGAEIFHRSDCTFAMGQVRSQVQATNCHFWTTGYSAAPTWNAGSRWNDSDGVGYGWAFGYANNPSTCYADGRNLGTHNSPYNPFHRGWCSSQTWGLVYVR